MVITISHVLTAKATSTQKVCSTNNNCCNTCRSVTVMVISISNCDLLFKQFPFSSIPNLEHQYQRINVSLPLSESRWKQFHHISMRFLTHNFSGQYIMCELIHLRIFFQDLYYNLRIPFCKPPTFINRQRATYLLFLCPSCLIGAWLAH